ncbi:uncharacterized protein Z518_10982 [Rhinocladiella mackenziei CBS 650.93]|uniref:Uncharacterized protein n=1 Tax=Rhinocladiella mackenziei CBS 650.93 TaxID=1442369 RepID=A0A0D2ITL8_9EURO|nr:uncharacterized protein Z518_10982 [Rhinocladiella mackenziei CBS 650.93]KIX00055.1 hypothetical protein Z518_10982 [Rhinocladiella mackenziei CBS 650.93]
MDGAKLSNDPLTRKFIEEGDSVHVYLGPDQHGIVNVLRDGKEVNALLTHKDVADIDEGWSIEGKKEDVLN